VGKAAKPGKRLLVGITGGLGAGKSQLAALYREAGYPVFGADEIAREIVASGMPALQEITRLFGAKALRADGSLDRAFVRARITADPTLRKQLEAITHPRIQERAQALAQEAFARGASLVFYEAPLLFEAKSDRKLDKVICVHAPDELRIERVMRRDGTSREDTEKLLASQLPQEEKMRRSDYLVENSGGLEELRAEAERVLGEIQES
jgi:dephospho-CoA kinase